MHEAPLCEVGCPYAVRGFDFDYVGVLWLGDLRIRNGRWEVDLEQVHESGISHSLSRARKEKAPGGEAYRRVLRSVAQAYRIILTWAICGVYVYFEDEETKAFVEGAMGNQG